jgi:hypothetical protein
MYIVSGFGFNPREEAGRWRNGICKPLVHKRLIDGAKVIFFCITSQLLAGLVQSIPSKTYRLMQFRKSKNYRLVQFEFVIH